MAEQEVKNIQINGRTYAVADEKARKQIAEQNKNLQNILEKMFPKEVNLISSSETVLWGASGHTSGMVTNCTDSYLEFGTSPTGTSSSSSDKELVFTRNNFIDLTNMTSLELKGVLSGYSNSAKVAKVCLVSPSGNEIVIHEGTLNTGGLAEIPFDKIVNISGLTGFYTVRVRHIKYGNWSSNYKFTTFKFMS